ncbi:stimulator of interferon genes protein isoform X1 [Ixodes scapularis]
MEHCQMALQHWDMVLGFLRDQWNLLLLMGLVCQLCTWWASEVQWQHQRERRETAHVGEGMAWSFFFGYIRVLQDPVSAGRGRDAEPYSLRERISKYEDDHGVKLAVKKLFILLPSSCYIDPLLGSGQDEDLEPTTSIEDVNIPRAGTKERIFTNTVYKIRNGDKEPYYCLAEGATPLLTLHDMRVHSELSAEQQREQMFIFYHKLKELLERHQACSANFLLVPYCGMRYLLTYKLSQDHLELLFCAIRSKGEWNNNPTALPKTAYLSFLIAMESVESLCECLLGGPNSLMRYLLTYKLSQDHLELLFCAIRSKGEWTNNPTALQFKALTNGCLSIVRLRLAQRATARAKLTPSS